MKTKVIEVIEYDQKGKVVKKTITTEYEYSYGQVYPYPWSPWISGTSTTTGPYTINTSSGGTVTNMFETTYGEPHRDDDDDDGVQGAAV